MKRFNVKRLATIGTTFAVALGAGFLVQYGDAVASRWGSDAPVGGPSAMESLDEIKLVPVSASVATPSVLTTPTASVITEASLTTDAIPSEELSPTFMSAPDVQAEAEVAPLEDVTIEETETVDCTISLSAAELTLAMVQLDLNAPCHPNQVVAVNHDNLTFNAKTDDAGKLIVDVPALSADAFFIISFDGGEGAVAQMNVLEFDKYDRAVLQWQGDMGVELHAREFGAGYGENGHIWSEAKGNFAGAVSGVSGVITVLGDQDVLLPMMAEVYTFPSGISSQDGVVALSVEASITNLNCGHPIHAQTIQIRPEQEPLVSSVSMTMPACDAIGEYVLLKNVLEDLTLASK